MDQHPAGACTAAIGREIHGQSVRICWFPATWSRLVENLLERRMDDANVQLHGLLLGNVRKDEQEIITVEDFLPLKPDPSRQQPLVEQSRRDLFVLGRAKWQKQSGERLYAVGCYGTQPRNDIPLSKETQALINSELAFEDRLLLLLILPPSAERPCLKGFCVLDRQVIDTSGTELPCEQMPVAVWPVPAKQVRGPTTSWTTSLQSVLPNVQSAATPHPIRFSRKQWGALGVLGLFISTGFVVSRKPVSERVMRSIEQPPPASQILPLLGLQATRSDGGVRLTWNRESLSIRSARRGVLQIRDGSLERHIVLDRGQLAQSSFLYTPKTGNVEIRLMVILSDRRSLSESLRLIGFVPVRPRPTWPGTPRREIGMPPTPEPAGEGRSVQPRLDHE